MIFPAFVRSGNCDKSQRLITMPRIIRCFITKLYKLSDRLLITYPKDTWWRLGESNSWPPACKAGALPTKLSPQLINKSMYRCVLFASALSCFVSQIWWVWQDLNLWPHAYQACALTNWATDPQIHRMKNNLLWILTNRQSFVKEVIQPQVPLRLPCYDFTPVICHTVVSVPPKVRLPTSGATNSHGVTGGVYKARERIHRGILIRDY